MRQLETFFELSQFNEWPNAAGLNQLKARVLNCPELVPEFVCQSKLSPSELYYEQIIHQQNVIPTRPSSWHDLFNGLIWLQFPKTKRLLNTQHIEDIQRFGLSPRSLRRNNLTHFDECGVVVTYQAPDRNVSIIADLQQHKWASVFVKNRALWGKEINCFMFGHANLEMLLQPFIGLTGKWFPLEVERGFERLSYQQQVEYVDTKLVAVIEQQDPFAANKPLCPLPLLGIPDVWDPNKDTSFYQNIDYFRPKSSAKNAKVK